MKRLILTLSLLITLAAAARPPQAQPDYFEELIEIVTSLRDHQGDYDIWQTAVNTLSDPAWPRVALLDNLEVDTPRNELHSDKNKDVDPLHLNGAVAVAFDSKSVKMTSKSSYLNSLAAGVSFSAIEKTLAAKSEVTYTLEGHQGDQSFAIVTYDKTGQGVAIGIYVGSTEISPTASEGNIKRYKIASLDKLTPVIIKMRNVTSSPQAFVIINQNARK